MDPFRDVWANVRFASILLKKSFGGGERNFLELLMRFVRSDVHIPTAESSKNQHLPGFWRRSIFDFFNSIRQKQPFGEDSLSSSGLLARRIPLQARAFESAILSSGTAR